MNKSSTIKNYREQYLGREEEKKDLINEMTFRLRFEVSMGDRSS